MIIKDKAIYLGPMLEQGKNEMGLYMILYRHYRAHFSPDVAQNYALAYLHQITEETTNV